MSEFIYVLENPSMPGLVKIGRTNRNVSQRVNELSAPTGVPSIFVVAAEWAVTDSVRAERIIHERLSDYRVSGSREFFKVETEAALAIVESILGVARPAVIRDYEREDELIARAFTIVAKHGAAEPRLLEEMLGISYEEALFVIQSLRGRGLLGEENQFIGGWRKKGEPIIPRAEPNAVPPVIGSRPTPAVPPMARPPRKPSPITAASTPMIGNYQLPPLDFLQHPAPTLQPTESKEELMANARLIQQTLACFDIEVALGDITKGPTITRYELHAAPGVRLEGIAAHSNDLAAVLKAKHLNILTPIPGKSSVGVEVPNPVKTSVIMRDLLESEEWRNTKARIPLALGKDVYGHPIISDLAEMPHVLIAGSTGSGKSVCINAIICSLLYRFSPDQLRFVMIGPKVVELQQYNALPHLVVPVVTDPKKVILALRWVVNEMEKRYHIFARVGVRNIGSFNSRPKNKPLPVQEPELPLLALKENVEPGADGFAVEVDEEIVVPREEDIIIPEKLSYIVVIIDELADLMLVAPADVEMAIARITQMARPAGIHCIVATQRPTENVITDTIQSNIPARIALRCVSRFESSRIVGEEGAEKLLGKGDLLHLPPGSAKLIRAQGSLITYHEVQSIVDFIAKQAKPSYELEIHQQLSRAGTGSEEESGIDEDEEIIQDCIEVIRSEQKAGVSLLQRRLRLGYGRAARIMDELENRGIVGPSKGEEPRDILIDLDGRGVDTPPPQGSSPDEPPPTIQPRLVVSLCQHCSGKIEFDAGELGDRQSVSVPCPHCGIETSVSNPS